MAEDIESRMNFIIEQQAQFAMDIQALKERQAEGQRQTDEIRGMLRQVVDVSMSLARHAEETDRSLKETGRLIRELRESQAELRDGQAHTDRRLDALIDTVDKFIRGNGPRPTSP
jgi:septal ring factor EnvC (AmiA/AmiB activator)